MVNDAMNKAIIDAGIPGAAKIQNDDAIAPSVSAGVVFGFLFFAVIALLMVAGLFVEYTSFLGWNDEVENEELHWTKRDKLLVQSKTPAGKAMLAFSPGRNLRKMFYSP